MAAFVVTMAVVGVVAIAPARAANTSQNGAQVADGHTGSVDRGRENNEEQQYPINFSVYPTNRQPGATGSGANYYAVGMTENIRLHWIVVESEAFDFSNCAAQDSRAFGIDRGNDDSGTQTDESLLTSYKSYSSSENAIKIGYYKDNSGVTGEPVTINVEDQIVAAQRNCLGTPDKKGWYRITGKINGSTKQDAQTDYTVNAGTQWIYVCDCQNREEARQKLGPPPSEEGGDGGGGDSTPTQTPKSNDGGGDDSTATPTQTPKSNDGGDDSTPTRTSGGGSPTTATTTSGSGGNQTTPTATRGGNRGGGPTTPTQSGGPGFGLTAALAALGAIAALAVRRRT